MRVDGTPAPKPRARERLLHELRKMAFLSLYLFVCFNAVLLYKAAVLSEHGINGWKFGFAAGKALILAKFILLGEAFRVGERRAARTVFLRILVRSLMFLVLLAVLTTIEEWVVVRLHGQDFLQRLAEPGALMELLAEGFLLFLILVPYIAVAEIDRALGEGGFRKLLFTKNANQ
jgi:hypothetical protein